MLRIYLEQFFRTLSKDVSVTGVSVNGPCNEREASRDEPEMSTKEMTFRGDMTECAGVSYQ
jgi:hypothetical protein